MPHLHIHVYQKLLAKCGIYHGLPHIYSWVFIYLRHIFGEQIWANQFFCACIIAKIPKQLKEESKVKRNFQQRNDSNNNMKFVPRHFVLPFVCLFVFFHYWMWILALDFILHRNAFCGLSIDYLSEENIEIDLLFWTKLK